MNEYVERTTKLYKRLTRSAIFCVFLGVFSDSIFFISASAKLGHPFYVAWVILFSSINGGLILWNVLAIRRYRESIDDAKAMAERIERKTELLRELYNQQRHDGGKYD